MSTTAASTFPSNQDAEKSEARMPISAAELRTALNLVVRDSLLPVTTGLSALYAVIAVSHLLVLF
jgi:hypothetical protein